MAIKSFNGRYVLDATGNKPVPCPDLMTWAEWMESAQRVVAQETVDGRKVSTIFTGLDYAFGGPAPILWETAVFGDEADATGYAQDRCGGNREQAEAMHAEIVTKVRNGLV